MTRIYFTISLSLSLSFLISSCSQSKQVECQQFFTIVNKVNQEAKPLKNQSIDGLKNWLEAANKIEGSAQEMKALVVKDTELKASQDNLINSYLSYAQATRDFVKAIENKDREAAEKAKLKVEEAGKLEQEVGDQLNSYCRPQ